MSDQVTVASIYNCVRCFLYFTASLCFYGLRLTKYNWIVLFLGFIRNDLVYNFMSVNG